MQFLFRNPHSFVHVLAPDKDGVMQRWAISNPGNHGDLGLLTHVFRVDDRHLDSDAYLAFDPRYSPTGSDTMFKSCRMDTLPRVLLTLDFEFVLHPSNIELASLDAR